MSTVELLRDSTDSSEGPKAELHVHRNSQNHLFVSLPATGGGAISAQQKDRLCLPDFAQTSKHVDVLSCTNTKFQERTGIIRQIQKQKQTKIREGRNLSDIYPQKGT